MTGGLHPALILLIVAGMTIPKQGFAGLLVGAFRYPFQGDGAYLIGGGAVFFTVADFVSAHASIVGIVIQVMVAGYLAAYSKDVVRSSAMEEDEPPKWLDFTDWMNDLLVPVLEFLWVIALSFGAVILLQFISPFQGQAQRVATVVAGVWGCLSFPILFLTVALTDSALAVVNPLPLIRAVALTGRTYLLTCGFCLLIVGLDYGISRLQSIAGGIPIVSPFIGWLIMLYLLTTLMRGIGLFYRVNHDKLGWY
jgi:hypothetical protein